MDTFIKEIAELLGTTLQMRGADIASLIERPQKANQGDYALPCFFLGKEQGRNPVEIARELADQLAPAGSIEKIAAAGPYLNFFVNRIAFVGRAIGAVIKTGATYGHSTVGAGQTLVLDYSSPNIAKPFGIGHLRSTVIGHAIKKLHDALGYKTIGINHLGDWGTQFGSMIVAYKKWSDKPAEELTVSELVALYVKFHAESEADPALQDAARAAFKKLEEGDPEHVALWERFKADSLKEFDRIYDMLGVHIDVASGESFFNDKMGGTIKRLKAAGLATESEGALIVDLEGHGMPPCLLLKSDGATLYATRDLAAAEYRYQTYKFDRMVYVHGQEQKLHFKQVFKVLELLDREWAHGLVHAEFGHYRFKDAKMSTRKGKTILLEEVLNKAIELAEKIVTEKNPDLEDKTNVCRAVGIGAIIFADLSNRRKRDVEFDWDRILSFEGETGPYLQYAHVRVCSIERKWGKPIGPDTNLELLTEEAEFQLAKKLADFPPTIRRAAEQYEPSLVSTYLLEVAREFSSYYEAHRVLNEAAPDLTAARLTLVAAVRQTLANGLRLLGIEPLSEM